MSKSLSRLTKMELRNVWNNEATDFTRWLALPENIEVLGEAIGIIINPIQVEANVGRYSLDILAEEEGSERKIIIENQLESTDHDHLGKLITYASGLDAEIIIWISKDVKEEHKKAIEWLNEHSDEKIHFFLLKIELWQIDNSNPAPRFEVHVRPNEWAKTIKSTAVDRELTDTKLSQLELWKNLKDYITSRDKSIKLRTPRPQHWYNMSMGTSVAHIALSANTLKNFIATELYIDRDKGLFKYLQERRVQIEQEIGEELEWIDAEIASRIKSEHPTDDVLGNNIENFEWFYKQTLKFKKVFLKYIQEYVKYDAGIGGNITSLSP